MKSLCKIVLISLWSQTVLGQSTVIDLADCISNTENQMVVDRFYQQTSGKLTIYYSFGSLVLEHQPKLKSLRVIAEEELSEEVAEPDEVSCPLNIATRINWLYLQEGRARDNPPSKKHLIEAGCYPVKPQ